MPISYREPLERAWQRSRALLLQPFNLESWFIIGFTAWLARLWDGSIWGGDGGLRWEIDDDDHFGGLVGSGVERILDALGHPLEFFVTVMLLLLFLAIGAALAWVGSRGAMMFFDNVAWRRGRVSDPWQRLGRLGDSLFLWRVATQLLAGLLVLALILPMLVLVAPAVAVGGLFAGLGVAGAILTFLAGLILGLAVAFVGFCTDQFVVPLMHRYDEGVLAAWERFLPLLRSRPQAFVLMALVYLLVWIVVSMAVFAAGAVTCCALFLVLSIPFVGTLVLLPVHVTLRAFGPEFLVQFGPEFDCLPDEGRVDPGDIGPFTDAPEPEPETAEPETPETDEDEPQGP
jgi:hypothetical protein